MIYLVLLCSGYLCYYHTPLLRYLSDSHHWMQLCKYWFR